MASARSAIEPAYEGMKEFLFRPFAIERWFVLGFLSFLQSLSGGCNLPGFNTGANPEKIEMPDVTAFFHQYFVWIVIGGIVLALFVIVLAALFYWLSSRSAFAYLHCIRNRTAEVIAPWKEYRVEGNSLFAWRLSIFYGFLLAMVVAIAPLGVFAWRGVASGDMGFIIAVIVTVMILVLVALVFAAIEFLFIDFIVPLQLKNRIRCRDAWDRLIVLLQAEPGSFIIFALYKFLFGLLLVAVILVGGCLTCCIGWILMIIPIINHVLLQPFMVFNRLFSLHFLRQFGEEHDLIIG